MAAQNPVIIDLTLDDDENGHSDSSSRSLVPPPGWEHVSQQLRRLPTLGVFSPVAPRSDAHGNDADDDDANEPPTKRRRTASTANEPRLRANLPDSSARLVFYLKSTLWPYIDEVIQELVPGLKGHQKNKLHYTVNSLVTRSDEFATEWEKTGGHPSASLEATIRTMIRGLVAQLKHQPGRLKSPPVRKRPDVEPSIEGTPHAQHQSTNGGARSSSRTAIPTPREPNAPTNGIHTPARDLRHTANPVANGPQSKPCEKKKARRTASKAVPTPRQSAHAMQHTQVVDPMAVSPWSGTRSRPYLAADERREVLGQPEEAFYLPDSDVTSLPAVLHVDFSDVEVNYLQLVARHCYGSNHRVTRDTLGDLRHLIKKSKKLNWPNKIIEAHKRRYEGMLKTPPPTITARSAEDINNFLRDLLKRKVQSGPAQKFTLDRDESPSGPVRPDRVASLLYAREIVGNRAFGSVRRYENFATALKTLREDALEPWVEWTNCAGDIATFSWVSDTQFLCGTTTHSDSHNQQYNKEGNLLLGSSRGKLQAYPDHRIVRPLVSHGDNALDSMVQSQDPWLFCSVVDSDYDPRHNLGFTSSFDSTVKIWRIKDESMEAIGTWQHEGRVNFVVVSKHESGMVATATDVSTDAVRVYHIGQSLEAYDAYSCTRIHDEEYVPSEKWGYCPAAIRWGLSSGAQELLLIGYSPRSFTGDDRDIPEDMIDTGELCLWNTITKTQVKINSVAMQNVFEVAWHPSRAIFAVATSRAKTQTLEKNDHNVKTQVRIFAPNIDGQYTAIKVLDCPGLDINELVIRPNSFQFSYVAVGCTDGKVYVWDTAKTEKDWPMCILEHGDPIEEVLGEKELEDVGVKFISWGTTADRLYTGSSDGKIKVWNIRNGKGDHLHDLIEAPGPITAGAFSPNHEKLAIGDGTGRVYLIGLGDMDESEENQFSGPSLMRLQVPSRQRGFRQRKPFTKHPALPPPDGSRTEDGERVRVQGYLERGELSLHPHPCIGVVQGPNYANTGFFRAEAHRGNDINEPLLPEWERQQQENHVYHTRSRKSELRNIRYTRMDNTLHQGNYVEDRERGLAVDTATREQLEAEGAELDPEYDLEYDSD